LLPRKVRWLLAPEDSIGITCGAAALIDTVRSVADQTTVGDKQAVAVHCGQMQLSRQRDDQLAINNRRRIRYHDQPAIRGVRECGNGPLDLVGALRVKWLELLKEIAPRVTRAAILRDTSPSGIGSYGAIQGVAPSLGVDTSPIGACDGRNGVRGQVAQQQS